MNNFFLRFSILIIFCFFTNLFTYAQEQRGIQFAQGTWPSIKEKALSENKIIMVDVFTDWCGPCRWLEKEVFTNDTVAQFYNTNFINWRVDAEKGEGIDFAKEYAVNGYPTILFIDGSGKMVHVFEGSLPPVEFKKQGETALNPESRLSDLKERYDNGERGLPFLRNYIAALRNAFLPSDKVTLEYFGLQNRDQWISRDNAEIIIKYLNSADNDVFKYFTANRDKYILMSDSGSVYGRIYDSYNNEIHRNISKWSESEFNSYIKNIESSGLYLPEMFKLNNRVSFYKEKKDWNKYAESVIELVEKFTSYSDKQEAANVLNTYAFNFCENIDNIKFLKKALKWSKKSVELDENYDNLDTYASLFYKLGDKENALKYGSKAIDKAKANGQDYKSTQKMVDAIKKK